MEVFGGTNPRQIFTMMMPGTTLNATDFAYDTTLEKPAIVQQAESKLVDQMFDISKVSGSSNGQHVSSQYMQALSVLVPKFNYMMPEVKQTLRNFLNQKVPDGTLLDDKPFDGTLQQYYFHLYDEYIAVKEAWEQKIVDKKNELSSSPGNEKELYLEWYEEVAEGELAKIDEALGKILGVFSPSDMNAILGTLASGPGGEVEEASNTVRDIRLASPTGGFFYPVDITPTDWFLDLASDMNPVDLLKDPEFIASSITAKRKAVASSVFQIQSMLVDMPTKRNIKAAADQMAAAQKAYTDAQNNIMNVYTDNTATAIEMYLSKYGADAATQKATNDPSGAKKEIDGNAAKASKAKKEDPPAESAEKRVEEATMPITPEDVKKLVEGQKKLIQAQSNLTTSSQRLSDAGMDLASKESQYFGQLPLVLKRLQAQLSEIDNQIKNLNMSSNNSDSDGMDVNPTYPDISAADLTAAANTLKTVEALDANSDLAAVKAAVTAPTYLTTAMGTFLGDASAKIQNMVEAMSETMATQSEAVSALRQAIETAVSASSVTTKTKFIAAVKTADTTTGKVIWTKIKDNTGDIPALNTALGTILDGYEGDQTTLFGNIVQAAKDAAAKSDATADTVLTAITTADTSDKTPFKAAATAVNTDGASAEELRAFIKKTVNWLVAGKHTHKKSEVAQRFMEMQLSFSSDDMSSSSSTDTSFSHSSWGVDLFFGSVGGSSSSSSSVTAKSSFDSSTEIKIGLKAAKVDIDRGWMNPGVFKLTDNMNRISKVKVSEGPMSTDDDKSVKWDNVSTMNEAIFPAFPTAFIIAKDISITFKVSESSMSAVHSVMDSKSVTGGGFLCFSASKSTSSHSDHQSFHSKTKGQVINIKMPGPQILGWYLETVPTDNSEQLTDAAASGNQELNILQYVNKIKELSKEKDNDKLSAGTSSNGTNGQNGRVVPNLSEIHHS